MKKISLAVAALLLSGAASASQFGATGLLDQVACPNLNEDVTLTLTTGVVAGTNCTAGVKVAFAACHASGMIKSRSVTQKTVPGVGNDAQGKPNPATIVTGCTVGQSDPTCALVTVQGAAVPASISTKGTVNTGYPGTGACTPEVAENWAKTL